jgi:membrane protein implicated in regulation of membrane protease activity
VVDVKVTMITSADTLADLMVAVGGCPQNRCRAWPDVPGQKRGQMTWITDHPVLAWIGLALVLAAVEVATLDFFFLMLAGSALAGAVLAGVGAPFPAQVVLAVVAGFLSVGVLRPVLTRRLGAGTGGQTGTAALVGRTALVVEPVSPRGGRIKLAGEIWSARTAEPDTSHPEPDETFPPGQTVRVIDIDGATAVVTAVGPEPETAP